MKAAIAMPSPSLMGTPAHPFPPSRSGNQQCFFTSKPTSTPSASPHHPYSVGQSSAPKLSPGAHRSLQDARTPSPNYFGLAVEPNGDPRDSSLLPRENWSPSSSVKSFAAAIPKPVPMEANPDFEAFRRQADMNRGKTDFSLTTTHFSLTANTAHTPGAAFTPSAAQRPRPPRWHTHTSDASDAPFPRMGPTARAKQTTDADSIRDSAYASGDSKRNSEASLNPSFFPAMSRFESPASLEQPFSAPDQARLSSLMLRAQERHPCMSLSHERTNLPSPTPGQEHPRAETLPPKPEAGSPGMISPKQLRDILESEQAEHTLVLDLRVSPQYAQSRVKGALNLCIPTTLLKRATFNLAKLQQTFQGEQDQQRFASWREASCLVVYDAQSNDKRDAVSAMNMIKKFANEGYTGSATILRGGFNAFAAAYPQLVDTTSGRSSPGFSLGGGALAGQIPPVIGGVMLPNMPNKANPFFSNIRQNQDLVDGVGQMDVKLPAGVDLTRLPRWLRDAAEVKDHGKQVSDKFLRIELTEQSRMRNAYSIGGGNQEIDKVQLSGIEQGGKNRYKDILPFEHARVRLQGRPEGACDYVNASHIQAKRSHKRYIASQGPLPATFEDFWSVIWDNDVRVIVMLTAESEGGQLKCHPYWKGNDFGAIRLRVMSEKKVSLDLDKPRRSSPEPAAGAAAETGRRRANTTTTNPQPLTTTSTAEPPHVILRKFALSHASYPFLPMREITQLHYPSWPDFGTPAQPSHLLALVELANVMQQSFSLTTTDPAKPDEEPARPMLVHCSAGCGRTGTFCTVDSVIDMMKRQRQWRGQRAHKRVMTPGEEGGKRQHSEGRARDGDGDLEMAVPATPTPVKQGEFFSGGAAEAGRQVDTSSWLDDEVTDLIAATVEDFREQRLSMVQSLRQFVLCYETVVEWLVRAQGQQQNQGGGAGGRGRSGSLRM
ncbi:hypothetical protein QBC39DRAFT_142591 [Podospora conica]|nr:hypothetical protein QBC39DRAFT_142591 [Schizothecium conicum]